MTVAQERGIGLAAFAVGVIVVVLALDGCGGDDSRRDVSTAGSQRATQRSPGVVPGLEAGAPGCSGVHSTQPVLAARLIEGRRVVRFAYVGSTRDAAVCGFAASRYGRVLYVELRRSGEGSADRRLRCVEGHLDKPVPPGLRVKPISAARQDAALPEFVDLLLAPSRRCPVAPRMQPSFIID